MTRRELMRGALGVTLTAAGVARLTGSVGAAPSKVRDGELALADFAPLVGTAFDVDVPTGRPLRLVLVEAVDRPTKAQTGKPLKGEAYSLLFVDPVSTEPGIPGATYPFSHTALGAFAMFVTPLGPGPQGPRFEAVVYHGAVPV